jgi:hypothetical protein
MEMQIQPQKNVDWNIRLRKKFYYSQIYNNWVGDLEWRWHNDTYSSASYFPRRDRQAFDVSLILQFVNLQMCPKWLRKWLM